jgi:hypothetical protein
MVPGSPLWHVIYTMHWRRLECVALPEGPTVMVDETPIVAEVALLLKIGREGGLHDDPKAQAVMLNVRGRWRFRPRTSLNQAAPKATALGSRAVRDDDQVRSERIASLSAPSRAWPLPSPTRGGGPVNPADTLLGQVALS